MAVRPIIMWPEPWLNQKSVPVLAEEFGSPQLDELVQDLVDTMIAARGVGISAPQLGVHKQIVVVPSPDHVERRGVIVLCNPVLSEFAPEKQTTEEGCLSLPGVWVPVNRPTRVKVVAKQVNGTDFEGVWTGLFATAIQHECDHLDGKTIADGASQLRKQLIRSKLKKVLREMERKTKQNEKLKKEVLLQARNETVVSEDYTASKT